MPTGDGLDENSRLFLERSIRNGRAVLFTGAGFSAAARNANDEVLPLGRELRDELWGVAFPRDPPDSESALGEVFDAAVRTRGNAARELMLRRLTVDPTTLPDIYETYFSLPWFRIYTLNVDTLIAAAQARYRLPDSIRLISGMTETVPGPEVLAAVHLNGLLSDFPNITFSPPQYGQRANRADDAYATLTRDLKSYCFVIIGSQLDEPPLWQHIVMRGDRPPGHELRPKSFLVTRHLPAARAVLLERYNIRHIQLDATEFANRYLQELAHERIPRVSSATAGVDSPFLLLNGETRAPAADPADFLLGREPTWGDITTGFAVTRGFEARLFQSLTDPTLRAFIIFGTAGSGKSTTILRVALALRAEGRLVAWLNQAAVPAVHQLGALALSSSADVVVIDRAERFGPRGVDLIRQLAQADGGPLVVAAYGSAAYDDLQVDNQLDDVDHGALSIPLLDDQFQGVTVRAS